MSNNQRVMRRCIILILINTYFVLTYLVYLYYVRVYAYEINDGRKFTANFQLIKFLNDKYNLFGVFILRTLYYVNYKF